MDIVNGDRQLPTLPRAASRSAPANGAADEPTDPIRLRGPRPRTLILAAIAVTLVIVLFLAGTAIGPFIVGYIYIVAVYPLVDRLADRIPRWAAVFVVYGLTIVAAAVFALFVVGFLSQTAAFAGSMRTWLSGAIQVLLTQLAAAGSTHPAQAAQFYDGAEQLARRLAQGVVSVLSPPGSGPLGIFANLFAFATVPFWAFYLMKDWPSLRAGLDRRLPSRWAHDLDVSIDLVGHSFSTWIHAQLIASVIAGAFTFLEFELLGLLINPVFGDVAFVMAAVGFVFEFIPNVGPTIALIPYLLVGAVAGPVGIAAVSAGWVIAQQLENAWIVPRVQSRATDLHPAVILFVLVVGAALGGVLGVILCVPVTSALWRIVDRYVSTEDGPTARWVDGPSAVTR